MIDTLDKGISGGLLEVLDKASKSSQSFVAHMVMLCHLKPENNTGEVTALILKILEVSDKSGASSIFQLDNKAIIIITPQSATSEISAALAKIRALFPNDPSVKPTSPTPFINIYYLSTELETFKKEIGNIVAGKPIVGKTPAAVKGATEAPPPPPAPLVPLTAENLYAVLDVIKAIRIEETIKRQAISAVINSRYEGVYFHELYTSSEALSRKMKPQINLLANKWLFQEVTELMDIRLLDTLQSLHSNMNPPIISLNLNISTILSKDFDIFNFAIKSKGISLIAEIQPVDIFRNPSDFLDAKQVLHRSGHKILLDGITAATLLYLDTKLFSPDFVKIFWSEKLMEEKLTDKIKELNNLIDNNNLILARCDETDSIKWGNANNIVLFQGRYIDNMLASVLKYNCTGGNCSLEDCINSYNSIAGPLRDRCTFRNVVEEPPLWTNAAF